MGRWLNLARELSDAHDNSDISGKSPPLAVSKEPIVPIVPIVTPPEDRNTAIDDIERFEERAAIIEHDGGAPRVWAEGLARLETMPRHPDFSERAWLQLIDDAGLFIDQWAMQVSAMGWTLREVFGVHPDKPDTRLDLQGVVPCLRGKEIIAISADSVTIQTESGDRQRIFRRPDDQSSGRIPVWELNQEIEA